MMHFSCDLCGKQISPVGSDRTVLEIQIFTPHEPGLTAEDLDTDALDQIAGLLESEQPLSPIPVPTFQRLRFDLCSLCRSRWLNDPLGREKIQKLVFSEN
jgi:hypothetical protein